MNSRPPIHRKSITGWFTEKDVDRIIDVAGGAPTATERFPVEVHSLEKGILETRHFGARTAIRVLLNQAADRWDFEARRRKRPTAANLLRGLERVQKSARVLHDALSPVDEEERPSAILREEVLSQLAVSAEHLAPEMKPYPIGSWVFGQDEKENPIIIYNGEDQLRADIEAVGRLLAWTNATVKNFDERVWPDIREDKAAKLLIHDLQGIWVDVLRKKPSTSFTWRKTAGGPMIRFVRACIEPLPLKMTNDAIRSRIRGLDDMVTSGKKK